MEQLPFRFRFAKWIMDHRGLVSIFFILLTLLFAAGIPKVQVKTIFKNLLPADDPFVQVYYDHPNFGSPLTMYIMVKRVNGDIYQQDTLQKVWDLTRDVDLTPGIDHIQLVSISTEKLRYVEATPEGVDVRPLMGDGVPKNAEEVEDFRRRVSQSPNARGFFVSADGSATLIQATFLDTIEYGVAFEFVRDLIKKAEDPNHKIYLAGQPALTGWVYKLQYQTYAIFGLTLGVLVVLLVVYMRNIAGVVMPIICAATAGAWGLGFIGWLEKPIEPLLTIVPLLLVARTLSHCIQYSERYYEILGHLKDKRKSAEVCMGVMMVPSVLGIMTDVFGIAFIAIAPIETMHDHAWFCGAWALFIIPTGVFLASILLSYLPLPNNFEQISGGEGGKETGFHLFQKKALLLTAKSTYGKPARITAAIMIVLTVWSVYETVQIEIGNPVEGSNLLWYQSNRGTDFNEAVRAINAHFPGMNTLEIVIESKNPADSTQRVATLPEVMAVRAKLQAMMEADTTLPPRATLSFSDYMMEGNRLFGGGNPQLLPVDPTKQAAYSAASAVMFGGSPLNFSHVMDFELQHSTVSVWFADNKQSTVDAALASAKRAVDAVGVDHDKFTVRMASGFIALQQAMNDVVHRYHWFIFGLVNVAIAVIAAMAYKSFVASLILLIPVNLANTLQMAAMHVLGIGLDINATIVAVMGVGVGIDYGIYLLSRICEEYHAHHGDLGAAITTSLATTGKAIMFTASIMLIGIVPWYFLSDLKFMADMGVLLIAIMLINMVLSLILLPLVVWYVKPKFMTRTDLSVGENIDLSQFMAGGLHGSKEHPGKASPGSFPTDSAVGA
ncbi:MAG: efflux RND transporter permease subunit [Panacagrimonas sp.]